MTKRELTKLENAFIREMYASICADGVFTRDTVSYDFIRDYITHRKEEGPQPFEINALEKEYKRRYNQFHRSI